MSRRKKRNLINLVTRSLVLPLLVLSASQIQSASSAKTPALSKELIEQWMEEISNWGRWGKEDQLGTLNLITPAKRQKAASLIKDGLTISLALPIAKQASQHTPWPIMQSILATQVGEEFFAADIYCIAYHGYSHTHIDALSHLFYKGKAYNGFSLNTMTSTGMEKLGVQVMEAGIISRGILIDVPKLRGIPYLELGDVITIDDITTWENQTGLKVSSGDVLLIRTGRWSRQRKHGAWNAREKLSGLDPSVAVWLKERDVAALGSDGVSDIFPSRIEGIEDPIHLLTLVALGMPLFDNLDLESLAEQAINLNRWEFMFVATPLRVPGGTGSPINPIAIF